MYTYVYVYMSIVAAQCSRQMAMSVVRHNLQEDDELLCKFGICKSRISSVNYPQELGEIRISRQGIAICEGRAGDIGARFCTKNKIKDNRSMTLKA